MNYLFDAINNNNIILVEELLQNSNCNTTVLLYGISALHFAVLHHNLKCVKLFLDKKSKNATGINIVDGDNSTPLHYAVDGNNKTMVNYLLKCGANSNHQNKWGATPLFLACNMENYEIIEELLIWNADVYIKNNKGYSIFNSFNQNIIQFVIFIKKREEIWNLWLIDLFE